MPLFVFLSEKERQEIDMNGTKSPLWSSVAILIGVVIGIFAVTTGKLRQSLLIAGIVISISETGQGAVCIQPLIYRLVCSNGMTVNAARTRRNHVGRVSNSDEDFSIYSQETLKADDEAFMMKIRDTVRAVVDEARFSRVVDQMREAQGVKLDTRRIPDLVKMTGSNVGFTETEGDGILQYLIEGGDLTLYGLANAVTRYSQDVESYDRASQLEGIGYNVLTMPPELFRSMNHVVNLAA